LSGVSKFPYFPKGGPVPSRSPEKSAHPTMGYVSQWGGMDVGKGMLFSSNVVDGLVHQLGGSRLTWELDQISVVSSDTNANIKCHEGNAVWTNMDEDGYMSTDLANQYHAVVHTVPPFYTAKHSHSQELSFEDPTAILRNCYHNAIEVALQKSSDSGIGSGTDTTSKQNKRVVLSFPLLGAGCRGFPVDIAIETAATATMEWLHAYSQAYAQSHSSLDTTVSEAVVAFAIPEPTIRQALQDALDEQEKHYRSLTPNSSTNQYE
jgi:O-acetyl-ADP-ribose deacetylase (regulator of RNase III)